MFQFRLVIEKPLDPNILRTKLQPGFEAIGREWVSMAGDYPAVPPIQGLQGAYERTNQLAQLAAYNVDLDNLRVQFGTAFYGTWALIHGRAANVATMRIPVTNPAHDMFPGSVLVGYSQGYPAWPNFAEWKARIKSIFVGALE